MAKYIYERWDYFYEVPNPAGQGSIGAQYQGYLILKNGEMDSPLVSYREIEEGPWAYVRSNYKDVYDVGGQIPIDTYRDGVRRWRRIYKSDIVNSISPTVLIEETIAEEGTYPDNGIQGDYWYIKTRKVFPDLHIKVNGELRKVQSAWVKVGSHTTPELPEGHREYIAYANSPDGLQDFSLTPDGHAYVGSYQGLDVDSLWGDGEGGRNLVVRANELDGMWIGVSGGIERGTGGTAVMYSFITVTPNTTLTFTKTDSLKSPDGGFWRWRWFDEEGTYISRIADKRNNFQWIVPNNAYQIQVSYPIDALPKLEKSNTATEWTPAPEDILADINDPSSYKWMSKSMYYSLLKEVEDVYIKKDGQLKQGV